MWQEVIRGKYGDAAIGTAELGEDSKPWFSSLWWRDICSIGVNLETNWFSQGVIKKLGNGEQTSFWKDKWVGDTTLKDRFPRLFSISTQKDVSVASLWNRDGSERWNLEWRRRLFVWESTLWEELVLIINSVTLSCEEDKWEWKLDKNGVFSVKSTYELVSKLLITTRSTTQEQVSAFKAIWKCPAPSKVLGFSWMLLHDRIPTRVNLFRRRIIQQERDKVCVLCGDCDETSVHLFIYCQFSLQVWGRILSWLGMGFILPHSIESLVNWFAGVPGNKQMRQGLIMVWNAVIWALWNLRNKIIFDNGTGDLIELVEE
ncbi:ribonuclease H protein, partial [Trifolium medium]|nr:ribonuclease H protein [Trifolium medium]